MTEQVRFDIVLKDLGSAPMAKFAKNMERQVKNVTKMTKVLERSFTGTQRRVESLGVSMGRMSRARPLTNLNRGLQTTNNQLDRAISRMNRLGTMRPTAPRSPTAPTAPAAVPGAKGGSMGMMGSILGAAGGLFAIDKIYDLGRGIVDVTANFEKYEAVLTNTFQSADRAKASMAMLQDFAAKTPFSVNNLTGAYVKLANRGFAPTIEEMTKLGDLASSTGKDFDRLVEMMLDTEMGENERAKEFGIKGKDNRDGTMTYDFKGIKTTIKKDPAEIRKYILSLGELKGVSGSMAAISKTLGGQLSNLGDNFMSLQKIIGENSGGLFAFAITGANKLIAFFKELIDKGAPVKAAFTGLYNAVAPMVSAVWSAASSINIFNSEGTIAEKAINLVAGALRMVTPVISLVAGIITKAANFVNQFSGAFRALTVVLLAGFAAYKIVVLISTFIGFVRGAVTVVNLMTKAQAAWNLAMTMNPIGLIVAGIVGLVAGILMAWNYFEGFRSTVIGLWEVMKYFANEVGMVFTELWGDIKGIFDKIGSYCADKLKPVTEALGKVKDFFFGHLGKKNINVNAPKGLAPKGTVTADKEVKSDLELAWERGQRKGKENTSKIDFNALNPFAGANAIAKKGPAVTPPGVPGAPETAAAAAAAAAATKAEKDAKVKSFDGSGSTQGGIQMNIQNLFNINTQRLLDSMGKDGLAIREVLTKELLAIVNDVSISYGS